MKELNSLRQTKEGFLSVSCMMQPVGAYQCMIIEKLWLAVQSVIRHGGAAYK